MKKTIIILSLLFLVGTFIANTEDIFGFQLKDEVGTIQNNLFHLYEEGDLVEQMNLGRNIYNRLMVRFIIWKFYLGGELDINLYAPLTNYNYYASLGGFLGMYPWDWLNLELGARWKDRDSIAVPYDYHAEHVETYLQLGLNLGKTWRW